MADWQKLFWDVPLEAPPIVVATARHAHGFVSKDRYRLPDLWSLHVYGYEADCRIDGAEMPIRPGFVGLTPPGATLETRYRGISVHLFVHFQLPAGPTRSIRAMQDLGEEYDTVYRRLYGGITHFLQEPHRVTACLWDILWELSARPSLLTSREEHAAVSRALDLIERHLAEPLTVSSIADGAGVSPGYLVKLFREQLGNTVVGTIRDRRTDRAVHLLQRSNLPIKSIASTVGMPDLQHFNKTIRHRFGIGPRELRRDGLLTPAKTPEDNQ